MKLNKWLFFLVVFFITGGYFQWKQTYRKNDGFSKKALTFNYPIIQEFEIEEPPPLKKLQQTFHYLGKGARSWAFLGEDKKTVLKFFKGRYLTPSLLPYKKHKSSFNSVLQGYKLAWEKDPEGTSLLYIHLNPIDHGLPSIKLFDKSEKTHLIDLNKVRFVLQEKAEPLDELFYRVSHDEFKEKLMQTFKLYETHFEKGVIEKGQGIEKNNGFINNKPVHFDVGKLQKITDDDSKSFLFAKLANRVKEIYGEELTIELQNRYGAKEFSFLFEGGQTRVYERKDGQVVLKIFRLEKMQPNWTHLFLPASRTERRNIKFNNMIQGTKVAFEKMKEACQLIDVQLNPQGPSYPVILVEKNGKKQLIDLKGHYYILQKKGIVLSEYIQPLSDAKKVQVYHEVIDLYKKMYDKGIVDEDHGVMHNIGYFDGSPFHIDVGRFVWATQEMIEQDFAKVDKKLSLNLLNGN